MYPCRYKGFLMDLDDTLYDYNKAHAKALAAALGWISGITGIEEGSLKEEYGLARAGTSKRLKGTAASHNRLLYFQALFESIGINPLSHALDAYEVYWDNFLDDLSLYPDALNFLELLMGHKICLVTDLTAHIQHRKVRKLGLENYAGHIVTSEESGMEKPGKRIFQAALGKLGINPGEACMVGDNLEKDVAGAMGLGIRCFWVCRGAKTDNAPGTVTTVSSFDEILDYII